ncbi:MAG: XRE family transcriptional regulator [Chitinophagaceae bacterium]
MSIIAKNIRHLRSLKKLSQEQLADELSITRSRLGGYEESRNEPPIELLIKISNYFKISVDALIKGDLTKTSPDKLMNIGKNRILFPILLDQQENDLIEIVPVKSMAGYLNGYADPEFIEGLQTMNLPFKIVGKHRTFPIKGDSMPPLETGDYVVGKYIESVADVKDGNTYILLTKDEGLVYKRVYNHIKKEGLLLLVSDNKTYDPYQVKPNDVLEIWEYVCSIRTANKKAEEINMNSIMAMLRDMKVEMASLKK